MSRLICLLILFLSFPLLSANQHEGVLGDNFHEIDNSLYFRSAQLSSKSLKKYVTKHKIKTVINLRGVSSKEWYKKQIQAVRELGIVQHDIGMSARRLPHREDLLKLLDLFENVERPILVHCQGGADRTGEASAIYQMLYMAKTKEEALKMLRFKYHHLAWRMPAKRYFIDEIWNGVDWALNDYRPCESSWKYYDREKFCN